MIDLVSNLYIRHAVGSRLLLDCKQLQVPFNISCQDEDHNWRITIQGVDKEVYELLVSNEKDLNIFFQNMDGGKDWYYASNAPHLTYHPEDKILTLIVDSKMSY